MAYFIFLKPEAGGEKKIGHPIIAMRLNIEEKNVIVESVKSVDPEARVYVFGSRADDDKRGGDIDLLIFSTRMTFEDKLEVKARMLKKLGEQKIDVLIARDLSDPFVKMVYGPSLELT